MQNLSKLNRVNWPLLSIYFHWTEVSFDLHLAKAISYNSYSTKD